MIRDSYSLVRLVLSNALTQTSGRLLLAVLRFALALMVAREAGLELFGSYALVLSFIAIAEWVVDFGQSDIVVRDLASGQHQWSSTIKALVLIKLILASAVVGLLWVAVSAMGYQAEVVRATALCGISIVPYALVLAYRAEFRATMQIGKDVGAELIATAALVLSSLYVARACPSLDALVDCYVAARVVHLLSAAVFHGRISHPLFHSAELFSEVRRIFRAALPIGAAGLLVSAYDAMDAMVLSRYCPPTEVGIFGVAARVLMLSVIFAQALGVAVFPVLSAQWHQDRQRLARTIQVTLEIAALFGGMVFCAIWCGAGGLGQLFRHDQDQVALVLQLLSWAALARALVTILSLMVIVSGRQLHTLWLTGVVVSAKFLGLLWLVPDAGALGAAAAYLISEILVGLLPTILLCQQIANVRVAWGVPLRALLCAAGIVAVAKFAAIDTSLLHGLLAALAFALLAPLVGAIRLADLHLCLDIFQQRPRASGPA